MTSRSFILDTYDVNISRLKCKADTPIKAAKKIATKLFSFSNKKKVYFGIRETTMDSKQKKYQYTAKQVQNCNDNDQYKIIISSIKTLNKQKRHNQTGGNFEDLIELMKTIQHICKERNTDSIQYHFHSIKDQIIAYQKQRHFDQYVESFYIYNCHIPSNKDYVIFNFIDTREKNIIYKVKLTKFYIIVGRSFTETYRTYDFNLILVNEEFENRLALSLSNINDDMIKKKARKAIIRKAIIRKAISHETKEAIKRETKNSRAAIIRDIYSERDEPYFRRKSHSLRTSSHRFPQYWQNTHHRPFQQRYSI